MVRPFRRHRQLLPRRRPLSVGKLVADHVLISPLEDEPRGPAQRERVAAAQGRLGPTSERQAAGRGVLVEEGSSVLAVLLARARGIIGLCNDFELPGHLTEEKKRCAYGFTRYKRGIPISSVYSYRNFAPCCSKTKMCSRFGSPTAVTSAGRALPSAEIRRRRLASSAGAIVKPPPTLARRQRY